jgi:hypothetical protein
LLSGVSLLESAACPFKDYDYLVAFTDIKRSPYKTYIDTLREQCIATATQ